MLRDILRKFTRGEDGAVSVDWIVLTAAMIGIALICASVMANGTTDLGTTLKGELGKVGDRVHTNDVLPRD